MLATTLTSAHGVAVILALTNDLSDSEVIQYARDLNDGHCISLPTGVRISGIGSGQYRVWPALGTDARGR